MPRIRSIKPEFFSSASVAQLSLRQMVLFEGLWIYCDDQGRGLDDPRIIKGIVWPQRDEITSADIASDLTELNARGFIVRYEKNGSKFLAIPTWKRHQKVNHPAKSRYPAPPAVSRKSLETLFSLPEALSPDLGSGSGSGSGTRSLEQGKGILSPPTAAREIESHFNRFWDVYPKHVAKREARKAFEKRLKAGTEPESMIDGAKRFADWVAAGGVDSPQFIPYPATWLNAGQEADELPDPTKRNGRPKGVAAIDAVYAEARRQLK